MQSRLTQLVRAVHQPTRPINLAFPLSTLTTPSVRLYCFVYLPERLYRHYASDMTKVNSVYITDISATLSANEDKMKCKHVLKQFLLATYLDKISHDGHRRWSKTSSASSICPCKSLDHCKLQLPSCFWFTSEATSYTVMKFPSSIIYELDHFYRAMHFSVKRGIAIACRLSVRPSVCL